MINTLFTALVHSNKSVWAGESLRRRGLPVAFWMAAVVLGGLHAWAGAVSHSMNPDGVAYIHMGEAYLRGDWSSALNSYWSPLYSWVLGLALRILNPPMQWEFPLIHVVNFLVYLATFFCFEFFWRGLRSRQQVQVAEAGGRSSLHLPDWAWMGLGYTFFIWSSLSLIRVWAVTPDMFVAAFVYLAAGILVRIQAGAASWRTFALLGIVLALGYLAKAAMFPIAFAFIAVGLFSVGNLRRALPLALVATVFFLLVGGWFIAALSNAKGRLTFSDAGKLMYAWHINGIPYPHWQGEVPGAGMPVHPTRQILEEPPIYEFGEPIGGTYPVSYDPTYWYEGTTPHFDLRGQLRVLELSVNAYFDIFFRQLGGLVVGVVALYAIGRRRNSGIVNIVRHWGLLIPALAALSMYAVVHVQTRYVGAFVVLIWAALLANVQLPNRRMPKKLVNVVSFAMILIMVINIVAFNLEGFGTLTGVANSAIPASQQVGPPSWPGEVAQELHRLNVAPGDRVAVIGYAFDSFWARLAHVQIVAEMLSTDAEPFWSGNAALRRQVIQTFADTGAKAIVAEYVPGYAELPGWTQVGNSNYYIYELGQ